MPTWVDFEGTGGRVAIYTGNDDDPLWNPSAHIGGRLIYHSNQGAIRTVDIRQGSVTLPEVAPNGSLYPAGRDEIALFAHGRGGSPFVEGRITRMGGVSVSIPLAGSIAIQRFGGFPRWLHLGASPTHVVLNWFLTAHRSNTYAAINLEYEIYVSSLVL